MPQDIHPKPHKLKYLSGISLNMGFISWLFRRKELPPNVNHTFSNEDRELSLTLRRMKAEIKQLELEREKIKAQIEKEKYLAELEDLKAQLYEDIPTEPEHHGLNPDTLLTTFLLNLLNKGTIVGNPPSTSTTPNSLTYNSPAPLELTPEQIKEIISKVPKQYLKIAKTLTDEQLKRLILGQIPNLSEPSLTFAISLIREQ